MEEKGRLSPLYLTQAFRQFAISLLSLFSGIYIYKTLGSLKLVFLFELTFHLAKLLASLWAEDLAQRIGLGKNVRLGMIFLSLASLFFCLSKIEAVCIFPAALFWGASAGFYWFGWHGLMAKTAEDGYFGQALGSQEIVNLLPFLVSPLLGGILINFWGFGALFVASLGFVIFSFLTLGRLSDQKTHQDTTPLEILNLFKTHKRMFLAYFGTSATGTIYQICFPLYLFWILGRELSLGGFFSLSLILVAVLSYFIGKVVDVKGKKALLAYGSFFSFLIWIGRFIFRQVKVLFVLDVSDRIVEKMTSIPLEVFTYEKALNGSSTGRAVLFREMAIQIGAIFVCLVLLIFPYLRLAFLLAAILSLSPLVLLKKAGLHGERLKNRNDSPSI